jgi:MFS family permease
MKIKSALGFVLIIGVVNLFADLTYEGARGIVGPFLGSLGASAAVVGFVGGFGELIGYALRSVSGYFADKTRKYWLFAFTGYAINMLAVPALALTGQWPLAAALVFAERAGRGIRKPTVEAMLAHAGRSIGAGWAFGLNEALDQVGATIGPLFVALILFLKGGYQTGFGMLLIPALICLGALVAARLIHPRPQDLEPPTEQIGEIGRLAWPYWIYLGGGALIAAGMADFALIGFHFQKAHTISPNLIPVFYAAAMATSALTAILFGRLFDKFGANIALLAFLISAAFAPFVFLGGSLLALVGMIFWGIGMSAQGSLFQAMLTDVIPAEKRSTAFGLFDTGYGIAWFLGSAVMGLLYDKSIPAVVLLSVVLQIAALPVLYIANRSR